MNQHSKNNENLRYNNNFKVEVIEKSFDKEEFKSINEGKLTFLANDDEEGVKNSEMVEKENVNKVEFTILENTVNSKVVNYSELCGYGESIQTKKSLYCFEKTCNNDNEAGNNQFVNEINKSQFTSNFEEIYRSNNNNVDTNMAVPYEEDDNFQYNKSYKDHIENKIQQEVLIDSENINNKLQSNIDENNNQNIDKPRSYNQLKESVKDDNSRVKDDELRKCRNSFSSFYNSNSDNLKSSVNTNNFDSKTIYDKEKESSNIEFSKISASEYKLKQSNLNNYEMSESIYQVIKENRI